MVKKTTLNEVGEMIRHVVKHMATKEDIAEVRKEMATKADITDVRGEVTTGFASIRKEMATKADIAGIMTELADIKQRLKAVERAVENHSGFSKEIDHAFERIAAIGKHLAPKQKARA